MKIQEESAAAMDPKVVFIDLDGTLVDSLPKLYAIYLDFLKNFGIKGSKSEFNEINGPSLPEVIQILKSRYRLPDSSHLLTELYRSRISHVYDDQNIYIDGALETLSLLKKYNLKLILVTSATKELASLALKNPQLESVFDDIVTGDMVEKGKPNPEIYLLALKKSKLIATNAVVIEDSLHGVNAAMAAGIYTIRLNSKVSGVRWHKGWVELESWNKINSLFQVWCGELSDD